MDAVSKIILLSSKITLTSDELSALDALVAEVSDWDQLVARLRACNAAPLFYAKINDLKTKNAIPEHSYYKLKYAYFYSLSRGSLMIKVLRHTVEILRSEGIEVLVLKGAYLAEMLYEDVALRPFGDIDLFVNPADAQRAFELLISKGYRSEDQDMMDRFFRKEVGCEQLPCLLYKGVSVDLHIRLHRPFESYKWSGEQMWENAKSVTISGIPMNVPDCPDMMIHTCINLDKHYRNGQIQFTAFYDIVNLLEKNKGQMDWKSLVERTMFCGCENIVFKYIMLAHKNFNATMPYYMVAEYVNYFDEEDQNLFLKYLNGYKAEYFAVTSRLAMVRHIPKLKARVRYVLCMAFPTQKYMVRNYNIKNENFFFLYYPYRLWIGLKGGVRTLKKIDKKRKEDKLKPKWQRR